MDSEAAGAIDDLVRAERLPPGFGDVVERLHRPLADGIVQRHDRLGRALVVGLCGPQGSGKSTAVAVLRILLGGRGLRTAVLSIDDVYLTRAERMALSERVHPLLATRGPPGTHDTALLEDVVSRLLHGESLALPSFDKATDDRRPASDWPWFEGPADVVLLEGWSVGAVPQAGERLAAPVNDLERDEDPDGVWRGFGNDALAAYQPLFQQIDWLIQFRPPDFETVVRWRQEQEARLRSRVAGLRDARVMTDAEVVRFVRHYERLTRHIADEMPSRADVVVDLGPGREAKRIEVRRD